MTAELEPLELDWYASGLNDAFSFDSYFSVDRSVYYYDIKYKQTVSDAVDSHLYMQEEFDGSDQDILDYIKERPERFIKVDSVGHADKHELLKKYLEKAPEKIRNCYHNSIGGWLDCIEEIGENRDSWRSVFEGYVDGKCHENALNFFEKLGYKLIVTY